MNGFKQYGQIANYYEYEEPKKKTLSFFLFRYIRVLVEKHHEIDWSYLFPQIRLIIQLLPLNSNHSMRITYFVINLTKREKTV